MDPKRFFVYRMTLPEDLAQRLDDLARKAGVSIEEYSAQVLRDHVTNAEREQDPPAK